MPSGETKTIVVTGATKGLGRAMTAKFIELGHRVAGCGRSKGPIDELRREFAKPNRFDVVDVADDASVKLWATSVLAECGPPDLICNNAAIINANAPLWKVPADEFSKVIDINIKGVANVIRHFVPAMVERRKGVIVNFSSGWGRSTSPEVAPYCATKWAIEGLTRALAEELPEGMAAVPLNPGVINTEMLQSTWGEGANDFADPVRWAESAAPFLLGIGPTDNGKPLAVHLN
jgi:NAD(P)-dependent dehydrogenase (short-subunit alcohol dehydrogenase family)